jgi:hypothetical protein
VRALYKEMSCEALKTLTDEGMRKNLPLSTPSISNIGQFHEVTSRLSPFG